MFLKTTLGVLATLSFVLSVQAAELKQATSQRIDPLPPTVRAGLGSFEEQVDALRIVNALRESPGNLLEQITKCHDQVKGPDSAPRDFCKKLLFSARMAVAEHNAERPRISMDAMMRAVSNALDARSGDVVTVKDAKK